MTDNKEVHWSNGYVSWAQLLGSMAALSFALGSAFVTLLITQEARMTRFEERQNVNTRGVAELNLTMDKSQLLQDQKFEILRADLIRKLDTIGADIVILRITFAKQEVREKEKR